jgi:transcriptional regulator with XRE-family HTH domain
MPRKSKERHFGQRIAAIRLHRGLSQGAVSRRTGIDPSYLSRLETGRVQPTVGTAMKIGGALRATSGRCLLDLLDKGDALPAGITPESYTTRQIRLLRRFMWFLSHCGPDVLKSLDVLSAEMVENGGKRRRA